MRRKVKDMTQATSCFMKKQKTYSLDFACKKPVFVNSLWFPTEIRWHQAVIFWYKSSSPF